jgi:hypothetical protein
MPTVTQLEKRTMLAAFRQKMSPTGFLAGWFRTAEQFMFRSRTAVIDVKRNDEPIAVDVTWGTGGRKVDNKQFTTKEYRPPMYDEYTSYFEEELNKRMPGMTEYDETAYQAQFMALLTDDMVEIQEMIQRSIEKQASDVLFTGKIVLHNGDEIDYKQKATHNFTPAILWNNSSAVPTQDILTGSTLNRKDGKTDSKIAVFGEQAWEDFLARNIEDQLRWDNRRANLADITPPVKNTDGAVFHGTFTAGSYGFQAWTYPQFYKVPVGFGYPNEGTLVPYVPTDKVLVLPNSNEIDLRLLFAGIPTLVDRVDPRLAQVGITRVPRNIIVDFHPYAHVDDKKVCVEAGVRSAPLCVPTQIDGWTVIKTRG